MTISERLSMIKSNVRSRWKMRNLSHRISNLAIEFFLYLLWTIAIFGIVSAGIIKTFQSIFGLNNNLIGGGVAFLFFIYLILLGIVTARSFDRDYLNHRLDELQDAIEHDNNNLTSDCIDDLRHQIEELQFRIGHE